MVGLSVISTPQHWICLGPLGLSSHGETNLKHYPLLNDIFFLSFDVKYEKISDSNPVVVNKTKFAPQILVWIPQHILSQNPFISCENKTFEMADVRKCLTHKVKLNSGSGDAYISSLRCRQWFGFEINWDRYKGTPQCCITWTVLYSTLNMQYLQICVC
jgi:hypothetical protein